MLLRRIEVRRRWQFAHTTSHFAISSRTVGQGRVLETLGDLEELVPPNVIEFQDDRVVLPAVHARMLSEILDETKGPFVARPCAYRPRRS